MCESAFRNLVAAKRLSGPLVAQLQRFTTWLVGEGYAEDTVRVKLQLLTHLGQWLRRKRLAVTNLDERLVEAFLQRKRRDRKGDLKTIQQFLYHLRRHNVVPARHLARDTRDRSPLADTLRRYETYLRTERGLVTATIRGYVPFIHKFLLECFRERPLLLKAVKASDISDFVLRCTQKMSVTTVQLVTTALRSFFRFLFEKGELQADLAAVVPTVADWRPSTVPKYLTSEEVKCVLKACQRCTATGRRDYAILLLLARLGLRAGEVVALQLEDINWRAGEVLVRGKGLVHDRMPLPVDVGKALASYLRRDRLACQTRRVFVCTRAPHRSLARSQTVASIVRRALVRADLHPALKGAHLFRHSLATSMLRSGATMSEIGEVLRHRHPDTTEIYAKVDFDALRSLTHPWPMGGAQ